ncbi:BnaC03g34120D [Brassica napus]|uniref:BnaC03g34120D protein n=1 Tax=Brassica napus TaxID=3708 RepID=A0A078HSJ2_BRANA|nr:BnaC03g34120D [Brassica napus]
MHRVASSGSNGGSVRNRKEKKLTYVLNDGNDSKHCAGVNCLDVLKSSVSGDQSYLFTGSRDGTLKRWAFDEDASFCSATFESHVDWVNDAALAGESTLVSCSSDTTVKTWDSLSDGACTRTFRQHTDYVTCLAVAAKNSNVVASGGLGGEVFIWDIEAALSPVAKPNDAMEEGSTNGLGNSQPVTSLRNVGSSNNISVQSSPSHGYAPTIAKGHKESVYALAMNDAGTMLVSGGTEKVLRVWDPRSGSKTMKLRGHTDNVRVLLLDSTGRFCLSGSSDSMIRLWDLGQQRCLHTYAVHTDSVWALACTPSFTHVYSGGRDQSLYLTDLATRESVLMCTKEHPIQQLALQDDSIWVATIDSSVERWPAEVQSPEKVFQRGGSFLAGNLSFNRARVSLEGLNPPPAYKEPLMTIPGSHPIVQHEILNNKRQILTKDAGDSVKLWDITKGVVVEDFGKISFEEKKEELFEMVSIPSWFTVDTRLGCLSLHLETPQCFSAEMYSADLKVSGRPEDDKINLGRETLKGLLGHWMAKKKHKPKPQALTSGDVLSGSQGGPWRKKITEFTGTEDEKDFPLWCLDAVLNNRLPPRENTKLSFFLHPCEGSNVQVVTLGKLSAPRILRVHKVTNYVVEKMVLDSPLDSLATDGASVSGGPQQLFAGNGLLTPGSKPWQKLRPSIEILCNNQVLSPEWSLATVRTFIWKKPEDLILNYRVAIAK